MIKADDSTPSCFLTLNCKLTRRFCGVNTCILRMYFDLPEEANGSGHSRLYFLCALRFASSKRLAVLVGSAGFLGSIGPASFVSIAGVLSDFGSEAKSVIGLSGVKRSARGSTPGAVERDRTCSLRASNALSDSSASGFLGFGFQKKIQRFTCSIPLSHSSRSS